MGVLKGMNISNLLKGRCSLTNGAAQDANDLMNQFIPLPGPSKLIPKAPSDAKDAMDELWGPEIEYFNPELCKPEDLPRVCVLSIVKEI